MSMSRPMTKYFAFCILPTATSRRSKLLGVHGKHVSKTLSFKGTTIVMSSSSSSTWATRLFSAELNSMVSSSIVNKATAIETMTLSQIEDSNAALNIWYRCSLQLQRDPDVALAAVKTRCIPTDLQEWPTELRHDIGFWNAMLTYQGKGRYDDHNNIKSNDVMDHESSNGWYVPVWKSESQIRSILMRHTSLGGNVNFWYTVLQSNYVSSDILIDKAHPTILSNKEFILHAIQNDYTVYDALCAPLNQDEDIVVTTLQQSTNAIILIPAFIQDLYPNAVMQSIRDCMDLIPKHCNRRHKTFRRFYFADFMSARLWRNRDVVIAWISKGGRYRDEDFPVEFTNDKEIFLLLAQHHPFDFKYASSKLRSDKEFMTKAIEINGLAFTYALGDLKYDFDLAVISYSCNDIDVIRILEDDHEYGPNFFIALHHFLDNKKLQHESFLTFAMVVSSVHTQKHETSNTLVVLNQGIETTIMILKLVQEFVGAPKGIELQRIQIAHTNVMKYFQERYL